MRQHNIWYVCVCSVWRGRLDCSPAYLSNLSFSFMGCAYPYIDRLLVVYTVSVVDLNLQAGYLCASGCAKNS